MNEKVQRLVMHAFRGVPDEMTVDFSEMSDQVKGCINSGFYGGGRTCVRVALACLTTLFKLS